MAKSSPKYNEIQVLAGVQPISDYTLAATQHYTYADKIRFPNNIPKKIGGWIRLEFNYNEQPSGIIRTIYSTITNGKYYQILGTAGYLYSSIGGVLVNITPFSTVSEPIPDSISTTHYVLTANPLQSLSGSNVVSVTVDDATAYRIGDIFSMVGASSFNGIDAADLNSSHVVRETSPTTISFRVPNNATSTGFGGGNAITFSSGLIEVQKIAHGYPVGYRVKISGSTSVGGVPDNLINREFIVRKIENNSFFVNTTGLASSSVSGGGGSNAIIFHQINAGLVDEIGGIGYGAGLYGIGLYGTALVSESGRLYPRIWYWDKFGETIVGTAGNQTPVYQWFADINFAPKIVENSPAAVNYVFVSNNILVTFGADGVENRIFSSGQNDITQWTSSSTNHVYDDDIEGAGRFISHCPVEDYNLIFTEQKTYTFRFIGLPDVWEVLPVDESVGIIASMARCSVNGIAFWMGLENFYMFRGGTAEVIPSNSINQTTCLRYVFEDINWGQKSKFFAWFNKEFNEVWFHYCSSNSSECDRIVAVDVLTFTWSIHRMDRSAAEYPHVILRNPHLANGSIMYQHEVGHDADGQPLEFTLTTNRRFFGKDNAKLQAVIPDSNQTGNIGLKVEGFRYPQSRLPIMVQPSLGNFTITPETERVPVMGAARYIQYTLTGKDLGQDFMIGQWLEEIQKGPTE